MKKISIKHLVIYKKNSIYSLKKLNKIKNDYFNLHKNNKLIDFRKLF